MGFPYKHCYFKTRLPTRRNCVENRDKAYFLRKKSKNIFSVSEFLKTLRIMLLTIGRNVKDKK